MNNTGHKIKVTSTVYINLGCISQPIQLNIFYSENIVWTVLFQKKKINVPILFINSNIFNLMFLETSRT